MISLKVNCLIDARTTNKTGIKDTIPVIIYILVLETFLEERNLLKEEMYSVT